MSRLYWTEITLFYPQRIVQCVQSYEMVLSIQEVGAFGLPQFGSEATDLDRPAAAS